MDAVLANYVPRPDLPELEPGAASLCPEATESELDAVLGHAPRPRVRCFEHCATGRIVDLRNGCLRAEHLADLDAFRHWLERRLHRHRQGLPLIDVPDHLRRFPCDQRGLADLSGGPNFYAVTRPARLMRFAMEVARTDWAEAHPNTVFMAREDARKCVPGFGTGLALWRVCHELPGDVAQEFHVPVRRARIVELEADVPGLHLL